MITLPQGKVLITMAPLVCNGPFASRRVDLFLLTQDPLFVPSDTQTPDNKADDPATLIVSKTPPSAGSQADWHLWDIRPGNKPLSAVPATVSDLWNEWRHDFITRLADGKNLTHAEQNLATWNYFNAQWNLVGAPPLVKEQIAHLQSANVNADDKPNEGGKPVPATLPEDSAAMLDAAQKNEPVAWIAKSWTTPLISPWTKHVSKSWVPQDSNLWTGFSMTDWPRTTDQIATAGAVQVNVQPGAVANQVVHLTNPTDKPITLAPQFIDGANLASWRVVAYQYQPRYDWQPMPILRRHEVTIPPHLTASLWLNFDARQSNPGMQKATLTLGKQTINFAIHVTGADIRNVKAPFVGGYCSPWPNAAGWQFFKDYDITTVHGGVVIPKAQMQKYGIKLFVLKLGAPHSAERVADIVKTLQGMGLDYGDWAWKIIDEPNGKSTSIHYYGKWVEAAKALRAYNPKIRIWNNIGDIKSSTPEAVTAMSPWIDAFCPYLNHWGEKDPAYQNLLTTLGNPKLMYTTPCFHEKSPAAPVDRFYEADAAIALKRDGWDIFALRNFYSFSASAWDEVNAPHIDQAVSMYPGAWSQVISSRNMEALREAVQRWKTAQVKD